MSLWDRLTGEFVDVIDWTTDDGDAMVWRFERYGNEIKYGAKLTVREGQMAVFVNEGRVADVFPPGMYMLETNNLPMMSSLNHWDHGFRSPFKAEIYFVSLKRFTDLKWGTKNPVMMRDPEFGPTRLRAFGTYAIRVKDAQVFLREIVGTDGDFTTGEIENQLRNIIVSRFSNAVASSHIPVLDLAANYDDLGEFIRHHIADDLAEYGLELTKLLVENVSLPPDVERALDRRTEMGVVGDLHKYMQFQAAEAMRMGAANPGGGAGAGIGAGVGLALGQQMGHMLNAPQARPALAQASAPPPLPGPAPAPIWHVALDGAAQGPFAEAQIVALVGEGRLTKETLVWSSGMAGWEKAEDVPDIARIFALPAADAPPRLPTG